MPAVIIDRISRTWISDEEISSLAGPKFSPSPGDRRLSSAGLPSSSFFLLGLLALCTRLVDSLLSYRQDRFFLVFLSTIRRSGYLAFTVFALTHHFDNLIPWTPISRQFFNFTFFGLLELIGKNSVLGQALGLLREKRKRKGSRKSAETFRGRNPAEERKEL
ncbi:hypothetical protein HD806DRAFT_264669 [Xylariaceae sp. AK1471]|nr:hypothetical protein HD806DRAFT_264669 [Xylariaceae sp. AK1471]